MFEIKIEVPSKNEIERVIISNLTKHITQKVGAIKCPEHGSYAKITAKGSSSSNLNFDVTGCCQNLIDEVKNKLK